MVNIGSVYRVIRDVPHWTVTVWGHQPRNEADRVVQKRWAKERPTQTNGHHNHPNRTNHQNQVTRRVKGGKMKIDS